MSVRKKITVVIVGHAAFAPNSVLTLLLMHVALKRLITSPVKTDADGRFHVSLSLARGNYYTRVRSLAGERSELTEIIVPASTTQLKIRVTFSERRTELAKKKDMAKSSELGSLFGKKSPQFETTKDGITGGASRKAAKRGLDFSQPREGSSAERAKGGGPAGFKSTKARKSALFDRPVSSSSESSKDLLPIASEMTCAKSTAASVETQKKEKTATAEIDIFYATDRARTGSEEPNNYYGSGRAQISYGECRVSIPEHHRIGKVERPFRIFRLEFRKEDAARDVVLRAVSELQHKLFFESIKKRASKSDQQGAFVFVHGFSVTFGEAARRTAQIAFDLDFAGAPILFSWPSAGSLSPGGYRHDVESVEYSGTHLTTFLRVLSETLPAAPIHLIAHSMGNRALARALERLSLERHPICFKEVMLTAPDIDRQVFAQVASDIQRACGRMTMYASSNDVALVISRLYNRGTGRAGFAGKNLLVLRGMDTIDVSHVDTSLAGHSYYAANRSVLWDMWELVHHGEPPKKRPGMREKALAGLPYWEFRP